MKQGEKPIARRLCVVSTCPSRSRAALTAKRRSSGLPCAVNDRGRSLRSLKSGCASSGLCSDTTNAINYSLNAAIVHPLPRRPPRLPVEQRRRTGLARHRDWKKELDLRWLRPITTRAAVPFAARDTDRKDRIHLESDSRMVITAGCVACYAMESAKRFDDVNNYIELAGSTDRRLILDQIDVECLDFRHGLSSDTLQVAIEVALALTAALSGASRLPPAALWSGARDRGQPACRERFDDGADALAELGLAPPAQQFGERVEGLLVRCRRGSCIQEARNVVGFPWQGQGDRLGIGPAMSSRWSAAVARRRPRSYARRHWLAHSCLHPTMDPRRQAVAIGDLGDLRERLISQCGRGDWTELRRLM